MKTTQALSHLAGASALTLLMTLSPFAHTAPLDIPDYPLFQTSTGVEPNIVLTLDDSGSMAMAYTPDRCGTYRWECVEWDRRGRCTKEIRPSIFNCSIFSNRYAKSVTWNPMYYDPNVVYPAPPKGDGTYWSTSFTSAHINGYHPNNRYGNTYQYYRTANPNLSSDYRPTAMLFLSPGNDAPAGNPYQYHDGDQYRDEPDHGFMSHFSSDVDCRSSRCQVSNGVGGWTTSGTISCSNDSDCQTRGVPAHYYVYDSASGGTCTGTEVQKQANNACYKIRIVGNQAGPADMDGNGAINGEDEKQNFANWYSFYRTRNLATIGAVSNAFDAQLNADTRVAWQALNSCRNTGTSSFVVSDCEGWQSTSPNFSNTIKAFEGTHKTNFFKWLTRLPSSGGTPLRSAAARAGSYFATSSGSNSPYWNIPGNTSSGRHACRKNYQIVMTDGRWNTANGTENDNLGFGNADSGKGRPYQDGNSNSLADIAYHYWATDLTTLTNNVPPNIVNRHNCPASVTKENYAILCPDLYRDPKNDPQYRQHMVNFTVGFGLSDYLAATSPALEWGGDTYSGSFDDLVSGTKSWPATDSSGNGGDGNVADLWHAALNSRGKFYNTDGPESLNNAFKDILDTISSQTRQGGGAGAAASQSVIADENGTTTVFSAYYDADLGGHLEAKEFRASDGQFEQTYWDAATRIPTTANRRIFTLNGSSKTNFDTCSSGTPLADALNLPPPDANGDQPAADNRCAQRLNWLRANWLPASTPITSASWSSTSGGRATYSIPNHGLVTGDVVTISNILPNGYNGTFTVTVSGNNVSVPMTTNPGAYSNGGRVAYKDFRNRLTTVLGDIMGSDLTYAGEQDYGYAGSSVPGAASYASYVTGKASRVPLVLAGANDGMLHAFRADADHADSGKELFAYVPAGVYGHLNRLPEAGYTHRFYVDGKITVKDAYLGSEWRTVAVAGLGRGGRSVFALDITNPAPTNASDVIKWEYNSDGSDSDMGLSFGKVSIVHLKSGHWAAVFGNGYNSPNEYAYLYIVDLATGSLLKKIATDSTQSNGLSSPVLHDSDGDGVHDVAYAGDLQGNLWRFDLSSASTGSWSSRKLFAAGSSQSITAMPAVTTHPEADDVMAASGSVLVYFGTGRYLTPDDLTDTSLQSFYAIWDDPTSTDTVAKGDLLQQEFHATTTYGGSEWRESTNHTIDWTSHKGWYVDLLASNLSSPSGPSERIITTPRIVDANSGASYRTDWGKKYWRVIFTTVTANSDPCSSGGVSWLMEFDLHTGKRPQVAVLNYTRDSVFDYRDYIGASDENNDGVISDEEAANTGRALSGTKLGDGEKGMVVSDLEFIQVLGADGEDPGEGKLYKLGSLTETTEVESLTGAQRAPHGAGTTPNPTRVFWRQIY